MFTARENGKLKAWQRHASRLAQLHIGIDPETQRVVAAEMISNSVDDALTVSSLLSRTDGKIETSCGNGEYDKRKVYQATSGREISLVIQPRKNLDSTMRAPGE